MTPGRHRKHPEHREPPEHRGHSEHREQRGHSEHSQQREQPQNPEQRERRGAGLLRGRGRGRQLPRRLEVVGLAAGLVAGLFVALTSRGGLGAPHQPEGPATQAPVTISPLGITQPSAENPAGLDAEWAAYSDTSSCADWAGGDGVSAVALNSSQIAWFFSDTYLGPAGPTAGFSRSSGFVHNSVVVQTTTGQGSRFVTMTGGGTCTGSPSSVVGPPQAPGGPDDRYWDSDGLMVGGTVIRFYNRYLPGGVPFVPAGTVIAAFGAGQLSSAGSGAVARPALFPLPAYTPPGASSPVMWGTALLRVGDTVYVYGTQTPAAPVPDRQLYLARVPASRLTQFGAWQFYAGAGPSAAGAGPSAAGAGPSAAGAGPSAAGAGRWAGSQQDAVPVQPAGSGLSVASGFSVVHAGSRYWLIQADPVVGSNDVDAYPAAAPWGPFDAAGGIVLYRNADVGLDAAHDFRIMYEARAEPALSTGRSLVISYNVNSLAVTTGCLPMSVFTNTVTLPRFISVPMTAFAGGNAAVRVGASDYPHVVPRDPSQWFDQWKYPSGCPPVPSVPWIQAQPRPGGVVLNWPDAGLGVRYQVYVSAPGFSRQATVRSPGTTLSGLPSGTYLVKVVPANLRQGTGPAAEVPVTVP